MILTEVYVENFGVLSDYSYKPEKGFNYVYGDNGTGKTTFAEFIKAMFYGLVQTRTKKQLDDALRKKYMPWNGGRFGGYICFEAQGKSYRLSRYFGEKEKDDTFVLTDLKTGLTSEDYSINIGEELFGLDRESYASTAWISGRSMKPQSNDNIHAKLGESMELEADMNDCEKGIARLEQAYKMYIRMGGRGLLPEAKEELAKLETKRKEQELCVVNLRERLAKTTQEKTLAVKDDAISDNKAKTRLEKLDDYFSKGIPDEKRLDKLVVDVKVRQRELEQNQKKGEKRIKNIKKFRKIITVLVAIAVIVFVALVLFKYGLFGGVLMELFWCVVTVGSGVLVFWSIIAFIVNMITGKNETIKSEWEKAQSMCDRYEKEIRLVKEYKELSDKEEAYDKYQGMIADEKKNIELEALKEKYENSVTKLQSILDDIADIKQVIAEYEDKSQVIGKAKDYLEQAKHSYISNYKENVSDALKKYVAVFDEKLAESIVIDTRLELSVLKGAKTREIDYFSSGYKDIMWFCERMAIADSVYAKELPVLIFDDAFLTFDEGMLRKGLKLLKALSEDVQVIYMTCKAKDKEIIGN